jgi:hypothetical protein
MYLLYSDETNFDPSDNVFFIYGGVVISAELSKVLSDGIQEIRERKHISDEFFLKMNPKPENLSHGEFIEVKRGIVQKAIENGCILLLSLIHHEIASSPEEARRHEINRIAYHFNCLLSRYCAHGLMLIDRFSDDQIDAHLRDKFSRGVSGLPYSANIRLDRILGYHYSAIGQSHFSSLVDIVIGSLRFSINSYSKNELQNMETAETILQMLAPLFYRSPEGGGKVSELSLFFSPKIIRLPTYRNRYKELKAFLASQGIEAEQEITDQNVVLRAVP